MPDVMDRGAADDLRLLQGPWTPQVALAGLPPLYRHGMAAGLAAAGLACTPLSSVAELAPLLRSLVGAWRHVPVQPGSACVVVVVPTAGIDTVLAAARTVEGVPIATVCVIDDTDVDAVLDAIQGGATGVVALDAEVDHVVAVVRSAARGMTLVPRQVAKALCRRQSGRAPDVSPMERNWLRHLATSGTVAGLAHAAGFSQREMYRLLGGLYRRLGARNRTEALLLAERWGLLQETAT
jgi:DNA-binding NarL/FixJ family response regulator